MCLVIHTVDPLFLLCEDLGVFVYLTVLYGMLRDEPLLCRAGPATRPTSCSMFDMLSQAYAILFTHNDFLTVHGSHIHRPVTKSIPKHLCNKVDTSHLSGPMATGVTVALLVPLLPLGVPWVEI